MGGTARGLLNPYPQPGGPRGSIWSREPPLIFSRHFRAFLRNGWESTKFPVYTISENAPKGVEGFRGCGETPSGRQEASGHDFTAFSLLLQTFVAHPFRVFQRNGWVTAKFPVYTISENAPKGVEGFRGCGETPSGRQEASGHDLSRAVSSFKINTGFSPLYDSVVLCQAPFSGPWRKKPLLWPGRGQGRRSLAFILTLDAAPATATIDLGTKVGCSFRASFHS